VLQTAASFQNSRSSSVMFRKITKFLTTLMHQWWIELFSQS